MIAQAQRQTTATREIVEPFDQERSAGLAALPRAVGFDDFGKLGVMLSSRFRL